LIAILITLNRLGKLGRRQVCAIIRAIFNSFIFGSTIIVRTIFGSTIAGARPPLFRRGITCIICTIATIGLC
jgi:hypothetical protein